MKKQLTILLCVVGAFIISATLPKKFTLNFNEEQGIKLINALEVAKKAISTSTGVSAAEASNLLQVLSPVQEELIKQYKVQDTVGVKQKK